MKEITEGAGVPVVYDSVGKDTFMKSLDEVRQTFPLKDAAEAHRALESRATKGSSILLP